MWCCGMCVLGGWWGIRCGVCACVFAGWEGVSEEYDRTVRFWDIGHGSLGIGRSRVRDDALNNAGKQVTVLQWNISVVLFTADLNIRTDASYRPMLTVLRSRRMAAGCFLPRSMERYVFWTLKSLISVK